MTFENAKASVDSLSLSYSIHDYVDDVTLLETDFCLILETFLCIVLSNAYYNCPYARFKRMLEKHNTTIPQALQLWMERAVAV